MNRRLVMSSVSVAALVAMGACTPAPAGQSVQSVFSQVQYLLPLIKVLVAGIAIAVPQSAGIVTAVAPYLDAAGGVFQTLQATMTVAQAQPIVAQVTTYLKSAVDQVASLVNAAPPGSPLAKFQPEAIEAQGVLDLIIAFQSGVQAMPTARFKMSPLMHK